MIVSCMGGPADKCYSLTKDSETVMDLTIMSTFSGIFYFTQMMYTKVNCLNIRFNL